jgi:hypothetical protein
MRPCQDGAMEYLKQKQTQSYYDWTSAQGGA